MKRFLLAFLLASAAVPTFAADVGVSISVGDPNFYGRIDIGDFPRPRVIYRKPVVVERVVVVEEPLYLRVPPGHAKNWHKYCRRYDACGRRVYFVQDRWYRDEYAPRYRERHGPRREHDHHDYRDHDRRDDDRDRHDDDRDRRDDNDHHDGPDHDDYDHGPGKGKKHKD